MNQSYYEVVIHIEADEVPNPNGVYDDDPESVERFRDFFDVRLENIQSVEYIGQ